MAHRPSEISPSAHALKSFSRPAALLNKLVFAETLCPTGEIGMDASEPQTVVLAGRSTEDGKGSRGAGLDLGLGPLGYAR